LFKDPFRKGNGYLCLCENFESDRETPAKGNFRTLANLVMKSAASEDPWFGIEQEYFMCVRNNSKRRSSEFLGWPKDGFP